MSRLSDDLKLSNEELLRKWNEKDALQRQNLQNTSATKTTQTKEQKKASDFYTEFQAKKQAQAAAGKPLVGVGAMTPQESLDRISGIKKEVQKPTIQAKTYDGPDTVYVDENAGFWGTTGAYAKKALKDWTRDMANTLGDFTINQLRYGGGSAYDPTMVFAKENGMLGDYSFDKYNEIVDEREQGFFEGVKKRAEQSERERQQIETRASGLPEWEREWAQRIGQTANMLPTVASGMVFGANAATAALLAQSYGGGLGSAISDGASADEARMFGLASAVLETSIEKIAGGIPGLGGGALTNAATKLLKNPGTRQIVGFIVDAVGEGGEEVASTFLTPYLQRAVYNPEAKAPTFEEYKEAFLGGLTGSFLLGGGQQALNRISPTGRLEALQHKAENAQKQALDSIRSSYERMRQNGIFERQNQAGKSLERANEAERRYADRAIKAGALDADTYRNGRITFEDILRYKPMETIKREYAEAVDTEMVRFAEYALNNPQDNKSAYQLKKASARQVADIKRLTGIDVQGFGTEAKTNVFRHIENDHGANGETDQSMADINDVARMQYVIDHYDSMELLPTKSKEFRDKNQNPVPTIKLSKRVNGNYYVVEAVPDSGKKKLEIITAYKEKAVNQTRDARSPRSDVQDASGYTAFNNNSLCIR